MQHGSHQLRDWQKRSTLNQRAAALKLGVHYTTYNQFLSGRRVPGRALAVAIQEVTGIPVGAWTPTKGGKAKKTQPGRAGSSPYLQGANAHAR